MIDERAIGLVLLARSPSCDLRRAVPTVPPVARRLAIDLVGVESGGTEELARERHRFSLENATGGIGPSGGPAISWRIPLDLVGVARSVLAPAWDVGATVCRLASCIPAARSPRCYRLVSSGVGTGPPGVRSRWIGEGARLLHTARRPSGLGSAPLSAGRAGISEHRRLALDPSETVEMCRAIRSSVVSGRRPGSAPGVVSGRRARSRRWSPSRLHRRWPPG
jgi:hypothetical protein